MAQCFLDFMTSELHQNALCYTQFCMVDGYMEDPSKPHRTVKIGGGHLQESGHMLKAIMLCSSWGGG